MNAWKALPLLLAVALTAKASDTGSHGGGGLRLTNGRIVTLDLWELQQRGQRILPLASLPEVAATGIGAEIAEQLLSYGFGRSLLGTHPDEYAVFERFLAHIAKRDPLLAKVLVRRLHGVHWSFRLLSSFTVTPDNEAASRRYPTFVQLAYQYAMPPYADSSRHELAGKIFVNVDTWSDLTRDDRIALIVHELVYAMIGLPDPAPSPSLLAERARYLTGCLFTDDEGQIAESCPPHPWIGSIFPSRSGRFQK